MKVCGLTLGALTGGSSAAVTLPGPRRDFRRVALVAEGGRPLGCGDLKREQEYVFHYPYATTPCFLIKLKAPAFGPVALETEDGDRYEWPGGVGPDRSVVSFSAICAHRMTHPSESVSFIGYRDRPVGYLTGENRVVRRAGVIQCCSEHSIYDPASGAKVLSGPAPQPLAAVELVIQDDQLFAQGVYGGALFERFFETFGFRLAVEFGEDKVRQPVQDQALVAPIERYTRNRISC